MPTMSPALPSGVVLGQPSATIVIPDTSAYPTVSNIAALRAFNDASSPTVVMVLGYYTPADNGGGRFVLNPSDTTSADNGGTIIVDAAGYRWYRDTAGMAISTLWFGCYGDNVHNDTLAFQNWLAFVLSSGQPGFVAPGYYLITSQIVVNLGTLTNGRYGMSISGVQGLSLLNLTSVSTAPALLIEDTASSASTFYGSFENITVRGSCPGPVVEIALPSHTDSFNDYTFRIVAENLNNTSAAIGIQVNGLYNCDLFLVANCAGHGSALVATEMQFCTVFGSFGNADTGIYLTNGYSFGNLFSAVDIEAVNTCLQIDNVHATHNTFVGGQFVWSNGSGPAVAAINATAGSNNRLIAPNFGSSGTLATSATGIVVYGQQGSAGTSIGVEVFGGLNIYPIAGLDAAVTFNAVAGNSAWGVFQTSGVTRWQAGKNNAAESGSNAGSNYQITRYTDAGAVIDNPLSINRATGITTITQLEASGVGFFGQGITTTKPVVTGSKGGNAALTSLMATLASLGLVTDSTS